MSILCLDLGARIGSFLDFPTLQILAVHVYGKELYGIPDGWNDVSRGQAIQTLNPIIFDPSFYSLLRKPRHLIQIMKKGFDPGGYPKTNQRDEVLWSIFEAKALKDHLAAQNHLRAGDRTWVLGLTALRHGRWTMVPRLFKETLFASSPSDNSFNTPPRLAPHVGKDALRVRGLTTGTPPHIKLYLAFILDANPLITYCPKKPDLLDEAMEFILTSHPCLDWGTKALDALKTIDLVRPLTNPQNRQHVKRLSRWFSGFSLDERLAVFLASISRPRRSGRHSLPAYSVVLDFWRSFASFLNEDQVAMALPDLLFGLGKQFTLETPIKDLLSYLPPSYLDRKRVRDLSLAYLLPSSLKQCFAGLHAKPMVSRWNPEWDRLPPTHQGAIILARTVQVKKFCPLYFFRPQGSLFGLWAELIMVTTPPTCPHFAMNLESKLESHRWLSLLEGSNPYMVLKFSSKPLWDFSNGSSLMAMGKPIESCLGGTRASSVSPSVATPSVAAKTYNNLNNMVSTSFKSKSSSSPFSSLLSSFMGNMGLSGYTPSSRHTYPECKTRGTKIYWPEMSLYGYLSPTHSHLTLVF